jgi:hypothetical protein
LTIAPGLAPIYQRATSDADEWIADRLSDVVEKHRTGEARQAADDEDDDGSAGALVPCADVVVLLLLRV